MAPDESDPPAGPTASASSRAGAIREPPRVHGLRASARLAGFGFLAALTTASLCVVAVALGEGSTSSLTPLGGAARPSAAPAVEQSLASSDFLVNVSFMLKRSVVGAAQGVVTLTSIDFYTFAVRLKAHVSPAGRGLAIHLRRRRLVYPALSTTLTATPSPATPAGSYTVTVVGVGRDGTIRRASTALVIS